MIGHNAQPGSNFESGALVSMTALMLGGKL
jgi:hypothetical protein